MKIASCLNTTEQEIDEKKFNIFIGISLGNKYFTEKSIKDYILWALKNTKDKVAILIPDKIHSINYEVKNGYKKERADRLGLKEGKKVLLIVDNILTQLGEEKSKLVEVLNWEKIETDEHKRMAAVLRKEFEKNNKFKDLIIEIVKENIQSDKLSDSDYEKLASYPLEELPVLVSGIEHDGVGYNLLPYPGVSKIDYLAIDLQEGKSFSKITQMLNVKNKLRLVEAYAE